MHHNSQSKTSSYKLCFYALISILITLLSVATCKAQEQISLSIHQDFKLGVLGDQEHGYDAVTLDLLFRVKLQGDQQKYGYMIVYPEFEYAQIDGLYKRYSANIGYTFNKLIVKNTEATATIGYGWIDRYSKTMFSFSATGELAYNFKSFKLSMIAQFTERNDLYLFYGKKAISFSGFVGVEFPIFFK
jgi:hypothetical protein